MADYGVFWKEFVRESKDGRWPCAGWRTSAARLGNSSRGDRLWMFTSGDRCGGGRDTSGYLVQVLVVWGIEHVDPDEGYLYLVIGAEDRCLAVKPPLLVDDLVRPSGRPPDAPIGTFLQGPRLLRGDLVDALEARLRAQRPEVWRHLTSLAASVRPAL